LVETFEATSFHDEHHQGRRISRKVKGITAYCLEPGDRYDWHSDTLMMTLDGEVVNARGSRYWTELTYVSEGSPIEIGNWHRGGNLLEYDMGTMNIPEPSEIIARIHPEPGKYVCFPSPFIHRVKPPVETRRWAMVEFTAPQNYVKIDYMATMKRYLHEDFRSELISPR
jgi:hypothetical protein